MPTEREPEELEQDRESASGRRAELDRQLPELYEALHQLAARHLRRERGGHTLQTTALVHEAWLKLRSERNLELGDREHFLSIASRTIRRVLVDHARHRKVRELGEELCIAAGGEVQEGTAGGALDLLALDEAIERLAREDRRAGQVIELRFFGGLSVDETAQVLGTSPRTVDADWSFARAWLARELRGGGAA